MTIYVSNVYNVCVIGVPSSDFLFDVNCPVLGLQIKILQSSVVFYV